jgi:hypothetical protein
VLLTLFFLVNLTPSVPLSLFKERGIQGERSEYIYPSARGLDEPPD